MQTIATLCALVVCGAALYLLATYEHKPIVSELATTPAAYFPDVSTTTTVSTSTDFVDSPDYVVFLGDVMLARSVERIMREKGATYPFRYLASITASSTATVINFESSMASPHIQTPSLVMRFSTHESFVRPLGTIGITHASLANNHAHDYGRDGTALTTATLRAAGVIPFGDAVTTSTSTVTYLQHNGLTLALVGIHTLFHEPTDAELQAVMNEVQQRSDKQIAYVHWGSEYELVHGEAEERFAKKLVTHGFDVIIGGHPHVAQDIGTIDGVPVIYSLGNFVFDQYFSPHVQEGFAVALRFDETGGSLELRPYRLYAHAQPHLMTKVDREKFLARIASSSSKELYDQIMAQNIRF